MRAIILMAISAAFLALTFASPARADDESVWAAVKSGGHVALIRHALAPGFGDPENFSLGDRKTQRNLSAGGRAQAKRIGAEFTKHTILKAQVYSSEWRRCMDTADLLDLGPVTAEPILNSFFQDRGDGDGQTAALKVWLQSANLRRPVVLVTHQVNISAFAGVYPASGEMIVMRRGDDGEFTVAGRILIK
jgi:8-oxo-(d)GTP phosphatase